MNPVTVIEGTSPIILGHPHSGTWVPEEVLATLKPEAHGLADTDWHISELYEGLVPGATVVRANFNRYVIDANRPPDGASLYPGQNTTGLVPLVDFEGQPIWLVEPGEGEIARRLATFHGPYHAALRAQIERVRQLHGVAVLYDCHSIRSTLPFLFEGRLPDLNIGTNSGTSCDPEIGRAAVIACEAVDRFSVVLDGRFKGGWTTRHYGNPAGGVHAIQMEIVQDCYLASEQAPFAYSPEKAAPLRDVLAEVFEQIRLTIGDIA
ncbi:N-formylglutamate deformylase [Erythrobacter mangrovi]|uniref:N-formylglutamate deformylase n=1 Tax=Erythrobacter mangrovi TaxID=2739433 RepID=A0A7D4BBS5_9SPHN|nr:N-formylglutamate deformylase [Erythrobacter mangrovi]QKG72221.1 N-formylglutamate deformylase [Erythrobacter mangrovi]